MTDELDDIVQRLVQRGQLALATSAIERLVALLPAELRARAAESLRSLLPPPVDPSNPTIVAGTPVLALRDIVAFPAASEPGTITMFVGRDQSVAAIEAAAKAQCEILLVTQKVARDNHPHPDTLYSIGTLGSIVDLLRLPDGTRKITVRRRMRARIARWLGTEPYFAVEYVELADEGAGDRTRALVDELRAAIAERQKTAQGYERQRIREFFELQIEKPERLVEATLDTFTSIKSADRQRLLELDGVDERLAALRELL